MKAYSAISIVMPFTLAQKTLNFAVVLIAKTTLTIQNSYIIKH